MRRWSAMLVWATTAACATGKYPSELVERPLTMPAGVHELRLTFVDRLVHASSEKDGIGFGYRGGITDRLTYAFPGVFAYRAGDDRERGLAVAFGLTELALANHWAKVYSGDPREPNEVVGGVLYAFGAGVAAKQRWTSRIAQIESAYANVTFFRTRLYGRDFTADTALVFAVADWLDVSAGAGAVASYLEDKDRTDVFVGLGAMANDSTRFVPTLALHVSDQLDLVGLVVAGMFVRDASARVTASLGFDWHFD